MNIPQLPTDNLYKFIALSGLMLLIVSFAPWYYGFKAASKGYQIATEGEQLKKRIEWLQVDKSSIMEEKDQLNESIANLKKDTAKVQLQELQPRLSEYKAKVSEHIKVHRELELLGIQFKYKIEQGRNNYILMTVTMVFGGFLGLGGFVIAGIGFRLWYYRYQIFQDAIIEKKALDEKT